MQKLIGTGEDEPPMIDDVQNSVQPSLPAPRPGCNLDVSCRTRNRPHGCLSRRYFGVHEYAALSTLEL